MTWVIPALLVLWPAAMLAQAGKPNILMIFGDDVGQSNISVYTHGLVGYQTANIDRIAREGMLFTDYYGLLIGLFIFFLSIQQHVR